MSPGTIYHARYGAVIVIFVQAPKPCGTVALHGLDI